MERRVRNLWDFDQASSRAKGDFRIGVGHRFDKAVLKERLGSAV